MSGGRDERTHGLGETGHDLLTELRRLIQLEVALAKTEIRQQVKLAVGAVIAVAIAAVAASVGALLLVLALADGVSDLLDWPAWAGLLTVAFVLLVAAAAAGSAGRSRWARVQAVPRQTARSLGETLTWLGGLPGRLRKN
jgi:hypothetical protein